MWVMDQWSVVQWVVDVMSFQKMYGLYGLKHHIVEISGDVTDAGRTTSEDRKTQLLICESLSFAITLVVERFQQGPNKGNKVKE